MRVWTGNGLAMLCLSAAAGAFLSSCDGSGDNVRIAQPLLLVDESPAGIYYGTFTAAGGAQPIAHQAIGLISEDHDAQFLISFDSQRHYAGNVFVDGMRLTGALNEYRGTWRRFSGVDGLGTVDIDGSVTTADSLVAGFSGQNGEVQIRLDYSTSYEDGSSPELTTGIWTFAEAYLGGGAYMITLDIDADGQLFGTDTDGCAFGGRLSVIDESYNVYRANIRITNCGLVNGDYGGLAFLTDFDGGRRNVLTLAVSNDVLAFASVFDKT